jgi:hypothetical protein
MCLFAEARVSLPNHYRSKAEHGIWGSNQVIVRRILKAGYAKLYTRSTQKTHAADTAKGFFRFE